MLLTCYWWISNGRYHVIGESRQGRGTLHARRHVPHAKLTYLRGIDGTFHDVDPALESGLCVRKITAREKERWRHKTETKTTNKRGQ